jgi:tRNA pseudouridine38-40 synthase
VWHIPWPLDAGAMHEAAQRLVGTHDFTSFRATACQAKSPVKTLDVFDVRRAGDEIHFHARGRSFLHHQVRNIVGTLERVGAGRLTADDVSAALAARDRAAAGATAPPEGLALVSVGYPDD